MASKLKYAHDVAKIAGCPCARSVARQVPLAVRFVKSPQLSSTDFLPRIKTMPPQNQSDGRSADCREWALSLYVSIEQAKHAWASHARKFPMFEKRAGSELASGALEPADGVSSPPSPDGHFSFHECAGVALETRFVHAGSAR